MKPGDTTVLGRAREIAERVAAGTGLELVLAELVPGSGRPTLRFTIDREGGVTIDDCANFSRRVGAELEVEDPLPGCYELVVSSPGLDRRLVKEEDFSRFSGRHAKIVLGHPQDGRRNFQGILRGIEEGTILFEIEGGTLVRLPFASLEKAR